ncbi:SRPBCC family protein [Actinocorallia populi]|uniref:SRPBCC family protein n=1 Tax=Actinocorallia populi TaxID=2079200 RepID=UPI000D08900D|nr:SRPBCC family protein [Actinocorallia populi]
MAILRSYIGVPRAAVWRTLADGWTYDRWVVGTRRIVGVDEGWPAVGAELRYVLGWTLLRWSDRTVVRVCEEPRRLELEARAGRAGAVRVAFELTEWGEGTLVTLTEHPLRGLGATLYMWPAELVMRLRNRVLLRRLARVTAGRAAAGRRREPEPAGTGARGLRH